MICDAVILTEQIEADDLKNEVHRVQAECLAFQGCPIFNKFCNDLRLYTIKKRLEKQAKDDPTSQE